MTGGEAAARRMFRYEVPVDDRPHPVRLSGDPVAAACTVTGWTVLVEFWAECDESVPQVTRSFQVFGTGHPLPPGARWAGTCPRTPGGLVFHLFELPGAAPVALAALSAGTGKEGRAS